MKFIFITLLITLYLPVHAKSESPIGFFKVDASHSTAILFDEYQVITGHIDVKAELGDSKIKIESPDISFESSEFIGNLDNFEVKGHLSYRSEVRVVTLQGKFFGVIKNQYNEQKMAINLSGDPFLFRILAKKPADTTADLYKKVDGLFHEK